MNEICGCCEGTTQLTPVAIANRPGLNALAYRVGTHAAFLETMKAHGAQVIDEQPRPGSRGTTVAFVHPKAGFGTLIELVQE